MLVTVTTSTYFLRVIRARSAAYIGLGRVHLRKKPGGAHRHGAVRAAFNNAGMERQDPTVHNGKENDHLWP